MIYTHYNLIKSRLTNSSLQSVNGISDFLFSQKNEEELREIGIIPCVILPKKDERYYINHMVINISQNICEVSWEEEARNLSEVKERMKGTIIEVAKDLLDKSTTKYCSAEMAGWVTLEKEAKSYLSGTTIESLTMLKQEADLCEQDYTELAQNIMSDSLALKNLRAFVVSNRYNRSKIIDSFSNLSECIFYESTPYLDRIYNTISQEEEEVTLYKDNVRDWS